MFGLGVALGAGGKFYQQVILFESKEDFDTFVNEGWEATSEASAVAGEDSEQLSKQFNSGVAVYQLNAKGSCNFGSCGVLDQHARAGTGSSAAGYAGY